jgi:hypothetical protein
MNLNFNQMEKSVQNYGIARCNFMRLLFLTVLFAAFIAPVRINAQGAKANLTGTWSFNESKSTSGGGIFFADKQLTIKHEGNNVAVSRIRITKSGQETINEKYTVDGKESINKLGRLTTKSVVTWGPDGKSLSLAISKIIDQNGKTTETRSVEEWILKDPKTLSIMSAAFTNSGQKKATFVYDKK